MTKITFFGHATTVDNENGIATGWGETELSVQGKKQLKQLKGKFDKIYSSDLKRAVESARALGEPIQDKRLRECNYGDLNKAPREKVRFEEHIEEPFPNGESLKQVEERVRDFTESIQGNVAVFSHMAPLLAMEVIVNKKTWEYVLKERMQSHGLLIPGRVFKKH